MPVYMIYAEGEPDRLKIGYASNVRQRVAILQTAMWRTLRIARTIPGARGSETWFHTRYRALHIAREWFHFDVEMLSVVPDLSAQGKISRIPHNSYASRRAPTSPSGYHAEIIQSLGGTTRLGAELGLTKSVLSKWATRGIPSKHWLAIIRVAEERGIVVTAADLDRTKPEMARAA